MASEGWCSEARVFEGEGVHCLIHLFQAYLAHESDMDRDSKRYEKTP